MTDNPAAQAEIEKLEMEFARRCRDDFPFYAKKCLKIRAKSGETVPLSFNRSQMFLHAAIEDQLKRKGRVRLIVCKGRQVGCSTYIGARNYHKTTHRPGFRTFILAHLDDATDNLFNMAKRFHEHTPDLVRPKSGASNAKELNFPALDSGYVVATAGNKSIGRSHTIQVFHGCLSPDTFIVCGETGALRRMEDMRLGDLVRTHTGVAAPISAISRQRKSALTVTLKGMGQMPLMATPEHKFYTVGGWRELSGLAPGDKVLFPIPAISREPIKWSFRVPTAPRPQGGGTQTNGPDFVEPSYGLGRILGFYLAEGCIIRQHASMKSPSCVTFAVHENEVERTLSWLSPFSELYVSVRTAPHKESKTVSVNVYGRSFASFVLKLCGELDTKRLPSDWHRCGAEFCQGLIHGYLLGDGHSSKREYDRRITAPSIRAAITVGMRDALAALGYGWASINYHPGRSRYGKISKPIWYLRLTGLGVDRLCKEVDWQMPPRRRTGAYGDVEIKDGYAHVPILDIEDVGEIDVMDFEIDHSDHSYCTVHAATHNSELAHWPNAAEHSAGIMQAIADMPGTEVVLESTANGIGNAFHSMWKAAERGEGDFECVFIPWFWHEEYERAPPAQWSPPSAWEDYQKNNKLTLAQTYWAFLKNSDLSRVAGGSPEAPCWLFLQEYPSTSEESFQTSGADHFITPEKVMKARKNSVAGYGPLILGVDPARGGKDKTGIIDRRGRRLGGHVCKRLDFGEDLMPVAGEIVRIVADLRKQMLPLKKVIIDTTGLGSGLYDRLKELLGEELVEGVNFSERAFEPEKYANRRAEMWDHMRAWFEDTAGVQIPDKDDMQGDLCAPVRGGANATHIKSNGQLVLEAKDNIKKRMGFSPDLADASALTFAIPFEQLTESAVNWDEIKPARAHESGGWMMG